MKTLKLLTIVSIILFFSNCTDNKIKNDLTTENLKGKVKSIKETPYKAIEKFGEVTKGDVYVDYFSNIKYAMYNENGNITEMRKYDSPEKTLDKYVYNYDKKGNLIKENKYNSNEKLESKKIYKYDDKLNLIELNKYNSERILESKEIYRYDYKENMVESNEYNSDGTLESKGIYEYNDKENLTEGKLYYSNGKLYYEFIQKRSDKGNMVEKNYWYSFDGASEINYILKYDEKCNLIESKMYHNKELEHTRVCKYDENNNQIEENRYDSFGKLIEVQKYKYKYDDKGNWMEKIEYENDIPKKITEREIEYYD